MVALGILEVLVDVESMMMMISLQESHVVHVEEVLSLVRLPMSKLHVLMTIPLVTQLQTLAQLITIQTQVVVETLTH